MSLLYLTIGHVCGHCLARGTIECVGVLFVIFIDNLQLAPFIALTFKIMEKKTPWIPPPNTRSR